MFNALTMPVIKKGITDKQDGNSESIIIFANSVKHGKVVLKISAQSTSDDNSMNNERDIYMFVKSKISKYTPHFLQGIAKGKIHQDSKLLLKSKFFQDPNGPFRQKWAHLRGSSIYENATKKQKKIYKNEFNNQHKYGNNDDFFQFIHETNKKDNLYFYYILLPRLKGLSLYDFITTQKLPTSDEFDYSIAFQMAQALCVAQKFKLNHNDLHPSNVFIEICKKPILIEYQFPFVFSIKTIYKLKIFDFDFAYVESKFENSLMDDYFCKKLGLCNQFIANLDWRFFLMHFVKLMESNRPTPLRFIVGGSFEDLQKTEENNDNNHHFARSCICKSFDKNDNGACIRCDINQKVLDEIQSPLHFLNSKFK